MIALQLGAPEVTDVSEPSSAILVGLGAAALAALRVRRRS
jgi:hypothetical protein